MVVDIGIVRNYIKPKADSTLYNMRKVDLIEYVRTLEHNYNVAVSFNENQAKYIESLTVQKWIPVTERLPDKDGTYLVRWANKSVGDAEYESIYGSFGYWLDFWLDKEAEWMPYDGITHWMPLPEPPKGE